MAALDRFYPISTEQPWPRNQWWVAANASEVTRTPMERTILGEPIVLYRTEAGGPVAMIGVCPHRGYPMVKGTVVGDALECAYHGFTFDCKGSCTRIPSQDRVPANWKIRTYPVVQKWEWIWIWTGDASSADPSTIPDPWCVGKPGWRAVVSERQTLESRYTLLIDNLYDLSHLNYIHATLVGDLTAVVKTPAEMTEAQGRFRLTRRVNNTPWSHFFSFLFPDKASEAQLVYTEVFSDYYGPCLTITGGPYYFQEPRVLLGEMNFLHAMTPETESTTHYFGGVTRDYRLDDADFDKASVENYQSVRQQDLDALVFVERNAGRFITTEKELSAVQDAGGIRVRRMLTAQIEAEAKRS